MLYLGCHLSASAGNCAMVQTALDLDANTFAFFTRNPRGSSAKQLDIADCEKTMEMLKANAFAPLVAHGAYTMNLCTADEKYRVFAAISSFRIFAAKTRYFSSAVHRFIV